MNPRIPAAVLASSMVLASGIHMASALAKPQKTDHGQPAAEPSHLKDERAPSGQLDTWINEALVVMNKQGIPGSYEGIHRNILRESGGNPLICNTWDVNAKNGTPSCGLLQVIEPTFKAHHCPGTATNLRDPVANICAASHYAWKRYGGNGIDDINGPY